jgi:hypothetical protein
MDSFLCPYTLWTSIGMPIVSPTFCPLELRQDLFGQNFGGAMHIGQRTFHRPQQMAGI